MYNDNVFHGGTSNIPPEAIRLKSQGKYAECAECLQTEATSAIKHNKMAAAECLHELGELYKLQHRYDDALAVFQRIPTMLLSGKHASDDIQRRIKIAIAHNEIGICYEIMGNPENAIDFFRKVLEVNPAIPEVYNNMAVCYTALKEYGSAKSVALQSYRLRQDESVHKLLADLYFYTKDHDKSIFFYSKTAKTPENLYCKSFPHLAKKSFEIGLPLYENRLKFNHVCKQTGEIQRAEISWIPYWDGAAPCRHLLVVYEQGIGDNIQYFRFLLELADKHPEMSITYFCKETVSGILGTVGRVNLQVVSYLDTSFRSDYKTYIMSLPYLLCMNTLSPNPYSYIRSTPERDELWRERLQQIGTGRKVGLCYKGFMKSFIDKNVDPAVFRELNDLGVHLICLHRASDISTKTLQGIDRIHVFDDLDRDRNFVDTVSILKQVDAVITVDTSIIHLAGVLRVPTLLLLGYGSDWRWFSDTEKSAWYASVEILRMKEPRPMNELISGVRNYLERRLL